MSYHYSTYRGDEVYNIDCTGDCVTGDQVCFERAKFTGSWRKPKFAGFEKIEGKIINDSYGAQKQQHTFTLLLDSGEKLLIKGRNLYANGTWRKPWDDEGDRDAALDEKHDRGDAAREKRSIRKAKNEFSNGVWCL
jgi:hypothetical protein